MPNTPEAVDPVQALAREAVDEMNAGRLVGFDPLTLAILIEAVASAIAAAIRMWKSCDKTPEEALEHARSPGVFARVRMNWEMRKHLKGENARFRDPLTSSLLKVFARKDAHQAGLVFASVVD